MNKVFYCLAIVCFIAGGCSAAEKRNMVGSKSENLSFLKSHSILPVPYWKTLNTDFFRSVVSRIEELPPLIEAINDTVVRGGSDFAVIAAKIRHTVENIKFTPEEIDLIKQLYDDVSCQGKVPIAVRSSATKEDLPGMSFAGLYDSFLNQLNLEDAVRSVAKCMASLFNDRALQYYAAQGLSIFDSSMGVIIQRMIPSLVSGTAFSCDISSGAPCVQITATYGSNGVVSGEVNADSYIVSPQKNCIVQETIADKSRCFVDSKSGGLIEKIVADDKRLIPCLSCDQVKAIAQCITALKAAYPFDGEIDTEFALGYDDRLYILQIRPLFSQTSDVVRDLDPSVDLSHLPELARGEHSVFGVSTGKILIVNHFDDLVNGLVKISKDDIVVANRTENEWTQFFVDFSGIITTEGSPTSHPMLIAREKGVPCLVGVSDAVRALSPYNGVEVTLDGTRKALYLGKLPTTLKPLKDVQTLFEVPAPPQVASNEKILHGLRVKGRLLEDETGIWLKPILYSLDPIILEIFKEAIASEDIVLERAGCNVHLEKEVRSIGGQIFVKWKLTPEEQIRVFDDFTIDQCSTFFMQRKEAADQFLEFCRNFSVSRQNLLSFKESMKNLTAYMDLSYDVRAFVSYQNYKTASELGIPKYFFEKYNQLVQSSLPDEDIELQKQAAALALRVQDQDIAEIQEKDFVLYNDIVNFSKYFKVAATENWFDGLLIENAVKIIKDCTSFKETEKKSQGSIIYFPEHEEFKRWAILELQLKFEQNRAHHVRVRGLWHVRDRLVDFAKKLVKNGQLNKETDILHISFDELLMLVDND